MIIWQPPGSGWRPSRYNSPCGVWRRGWVGTAVPGKSSSAVGVEQVDQLHYRSVQWAHPHPVWLNMSHSLKSTCSDADAGV